MLIRIVARIAQVDMLAVIITDAKEQKLNERVECAYEWKILICTFDTITICGVLSG